MKSHSSSAAKAAVTKLLGLGFVKEVPVKRTDEEEKALGLKLTKAGSAAIGLAEEGAGEEEAAPRPKTRRKPKKYAPGEDQDAREPRAGSKQAQIIALMRRKSGASLAAMVEATGWLPHTTRAALTGLRQKVYAIERDKTPHGKTVYRLPARARG